MVPSENYKCLRQLTLAAGIRDYRNGDGNKAVA